MAATWFGDSSKWLIVKRLGQWAVCPPSTAAVARTKKGGLFDTSSEAFAAYAAGADIAYFAARTALPPMAEPYHGKAAVTQ